MNVKMDPCNNVAKRIEEKPTIEPIERSIPAVKITKVIPMARIPVKLDWASKLARFR
jgi:hypothetical protein